MNERELQQLTEHISQQFFGKTFRHQAVFNDRLKTTGGRYLLGTHNIELNRRYLEEHGLEELIGIIKHELCHYHLHLEGKGYQHRDRDFKALLKQVGAPRFCTPLKTVQKKRRAGNAMNTFAQDAAGLLSEKDGLIPLVMYAASAKGN